MTIKRHKRSNGNVIIWNKSPTCVPIKFNVLCKTYAFDAAQGRLLPFKQQRKINDL